MATSNVSVKDVATHAGVSLGTVSNVLNRPDRVSESTRMRVLSSISALGFVRNESARQLRAGHSTTIGFIVLDVSNPFFIDVARGAERAANAVGSSVLIANSDEQAERERTYLDLFEEQRAQGVLISPVGDVTERLRRLRARGIPAVLVDAAAPDTTFSSVQTDNIAGGRLAVEHLIATGRTDILFVGGPLGLHQIRDRFAGARSAAESSGLGADAVRSWPTPTPTVEAGRRAGAAIAQGEQRPNAIFAANDLLAIGIMEAFLFGGLVRIPDEIALIGYDDIGWAASAIVSLTSVRQPSERIGETAARLLIDEGAATAPVAHRQLQFAPELVVRDSTRLV
ncbi:LacI family DNA-binding transcriptional regulator [Rathayibacter soli]|uniref:LacI family DNA-binding transcriptional regulator n=1 Tax=Rathayibacter soli TaxID=3144168 RepID=UPI0027E4DECE|nr:LacI family DNA-binding transcriptional regulator [Glaciibacter superstes]